MKTIIQIIFVSVSLQSFANDNPPAINTKSPHFTFSGVKNWSMTNVSVEDFRGKWLVIDAWSLGCSSCVTDFPKMNELHNQVQDRVTFLLVGKEHKNIRAWFAKYQEKFQLTIPYTFDSAFFKLFQIQSVPRIIIIDPSGIIRVITTESITKEKMEQLMEGNNTFTSKNPDGPSIPFDFNKPFGIGNNGGRDDQFLFRSVLTRWTYGQDDFTADFGETYNWKQYMNNGYQAVGASLSLLYRLAFVGRFSIPYGDSLYSKLCLDPVLEIKDTSLFNFDVYTGKNMFNYSLVVPDSLATDQYMQKKMQKDLDHYFNYKTTVETRDVPVWEVITIGDVRHLQTKGGSSKPFISYTDNVRFEEKNVSMEQLLGDIARFHPDVPIINKTGITFNIDIELDCLPTDLEGIVKELKKHGISLKKATRKMNVVVIRDAY